MPRHSIGQIKDLGGYDLNHVSCFDVERSDYLLPLVVEDAAYREVETRSLNRWLPAFEEIL